MNLEDFQNLDPQNFGNWPVPVKAVVILLICVVALGAGYYFVTQKQIEQLQTLERKEISLRDDFTTKQKKANSLKQLEEQLESIREIFTELLRRLPTQTEVADLLRDISLAAQANGLDVELFKLQKERAGKQFYKELPIDLTLTGTYSALGNFVSDVSKMERIVTQHNIRILEGRNDSPVLTMRSIAKIYRLEDSQQGKKGKKK